MFQGSMVALITPMKSGVSPHSALDHVALARLLEFHIENGSEAIVAMGTTGESATLPEVEHCAVIREVVELVKGRVPVIAGTGANSTIEAISLTKCAQEAGADACLLVTPYYNKPSQEGLYLHHKAVAEAVSIPQILYNVPGRTACDMLPETIARLAEVPNIIGVKEATGELDRVARIRELCSQDFLLFSGDDETACEFMLSGGDGVISVTANVAPRAMYNLCVHALAGNGSAAKEVDKRLLGLHQCLFLEANPIPVKWAVARMGMVENGIRLPMTWMSIEFESQLEAAMHQAGVL
jgi:4-hydroxy-tetrahydrodipicolinate synthase